MLGRAHHPDRGGGVSQRIVGVLRGRQLTVCHESVHRAQQLPDPLRVAQRHQCEVEVVEREVAAEREEPQPGVAIDVTFADLDEPSADGQQFESGTLCRAGQ